MRGRLYHLGLRFMLMIGGEGIQSGFHLGFSLALAHILPAHDYGIFALTMVFGGISLTYIRALTGMPASVWMGRSYGRPAASAYEVAFGSVAIALSCVSALVVTATLEFWLDVGALAGGLFVGLWSLRSHLRMAFFARQRQSIVAASDAAFGVIGILLASIVLTVTSQNVLQAAFLSLAGANLGAIVTLFWLDRRPFRVSAGRSVRSQYSRQWRHFAWSGLSVTLANLQGQAMPFLVSGIAGPEAYAPIAIVTLFVTPLRLVGATIINLAQPPMAALLARGQTSQIWHEARMWTALMLGICLAYGGVLYVVAPLLDIDHLSPAQLPLLGGLAWAIQTISLLSAMPRTVLEVSKKFQGLAVINLLAAVVGVISVILILMMTTPDRALAGNLLSELTVFALCWMAARRELKTAVPG